MEIDPANKVVQLCTEGMNAEFEGKMDVSESFFKQAWETASDNFEAFIAAHYMARRKTSPEAQLDWNLKSYQLALQLDENEVMQYLPSLCLNIGKSYEDMSQTTNAIKYYQKGAKYADSLPEKAYGNMIKSGLTEGLRRMNAKVTTNPVLANLIDQWCEHRNLKALSFILPAYVSYLGSELDKQKLSSALSYLSAARCLNEPDQQKIEQLIIDWQHETR